MDLTVVFCLKVLNDLSVSDQQYNLVAIFELAFEHFVSSIHRLMTCLINVD